MGIEQDIKEMAENLVYNTFEIDDELMEIKITGVEIVFDAGEVKVYLTGYYFIDLKEAFYKDDCFKAHRQELDKFKDKGLSDEKISEIAMKEFVKIDRDYDYYVYEIDTAYDITISRLIECFNRDLAEQTIVVEDPETGEVIEGRISEVLEDEYGHYGVSVNTDSLVNAFSNYDETVLIDYML